MKNLCFSLCVSLATFSSFAQEQELNGKIVDSQNDQPVAIAKVEILGTNLSAETANDGTFTIVNPTGGEQIVIIKKAGYITKTVPVEINGSLNMGTVRLDEDHQILDIQTSLVTLTDNDLGDDNTGTETTSGLLQSSRDQFDQIAAFSWGQARFRVRSLDNEYGNTLINGVSMNKIYDGRPQYSNWGGLNDAVRNQEYTSGSTPSDYTFGGMLGVQAINARASMIRPGTRLTASSTNRNYNWRTMVTYGSGVTNSGWAYAVSAAYRGANEGHFEGTDYDAKSLYLAIEKKFNLRHSLNLTAIYAQNKRGKNSPNTQEVVDLMGPYYNSYWGWQDGKKRNSRDKTVEEPIFILSHDFNINENTRLNTNVAYQFGTIENSRLNYNGGNNPDPTYYKNLPSYFMNLHSKDEPSYWTPDFEKAELAKENFLANPQIDWARMYHGNKVNKRSIYSLYADVMEDQTLTANSYLNTQLSETVGFNAGVNYVKLTSENYKKMLDLLGEYPAIDRDLFYTGDLSQADLNNPNREVFKGDRFGYNYIMHAQTLDAFTQFKFNLKKLNIYFAQMVSFTDYQREGLYKNGLYAENSLGKSDKVSFNNYGLKAGAIYKLKGNHILTFNAAYYTKAPSIRNSFANARANNESINDLTNETIYGGDLNYIIRLPKLKARIGGYYNQIKDATEVSFFYADGIDVEVEGVSSEFVSEVTQNVSKLSMGVEFGAEYQVTQTIKINGGFNIGQSIYSDDANVYLNVDGRTELGLDPKVDYGKTYIKNYRTAGSPQKAYALGIEYRDPSYWWIGADANYLTDLYIDISPILRTKNFFSEPGQNGAAFPNLDPEIGRELLKQEKLNDIFLVNLKGGKSWRIKGKTFGFFAVVNNVLGLEYKTGGFEQSRNANYSKSLQDMASGTRSFGPKYFYGYGRSYFVNLYINF